MRRVVARMLFYGIEDTMNVLFCLGQNWRANEQGGVSKNKEVIRSDAIHTLQNAVKYREKKIKRRKRRRLDGFKMMS